MLDNQRPILIFPQIDVVDRTKRSPAFFPQPQLPSFARQVERMGPVFQELQQVFAARHVAFQSDPTGLVPEQAIVFETAVAISDFFNTVRRIDGLEWMSEWESDFEPDEDFVRADDSDKKIGSRLFLVMANNTAMEQLLSLWQQYCQNPNVSFSHGLNRWKELFSSLRTLRRWGAEDRLLETGILLDWQQRVERRDENIKFEVEFWFRSDPEKRAKIERLYRNIIHAAGGQDLSSCIIPEISYHGMLAQLPIEEIEKVLMREYTQAIQCEQVMYFRPVGQSTVDAYSEEPQEEVPGPVQMREILQEPVIAILDGLPIENHMLLANRIIINDPDDYANDYPAIERKHGTWMASLVVHGQIDSGALPLTRSVYVRPILKPDPQDLRQPRQESVPTNVLAIDVVHRAVREMFHNEAGSVGTAPTVRIINFSIGDPCRIFYRTMSPWAKLIDWLSFKYKILFIISAGNHSDDLHLDIPNQCMQTVNSRDIEAAVLRAMANDTRNRRLLSPAESINGITVGALHSDGCEEYVAGHRMDPYVENELPSPCSAVGLGYKRAIKPDVVFHGGRQLFEERIAHGQQHGILTINRAIARPPGMKTAAPSSVPGDVSHVHYISGTSCAAALLSHAAGEIYEEVLALRQEPHGEMLSDDCSAVLLKALLVHGAKWPSSYSRFNTILRNSSNSTKFREFASRFYGFGLVNPERIKACTFERATLIGCGQLTKEEAHVYSLPLPPGLSGRREWRRITVTLAWATPINVDQQKYRKAALWFEFNQETLRVTRQEADARMVQRGTIQHEVFEGGDAVAYLDGSTLQLKVNCREDATKLRELVPYSLIVSLEVASGSQIAIYDEVRTRVLQPVAIQTSSQS